MKWYDPSDTSRPVISPAVEVDNFLKKHKSIEKFGMSDSLIMLLTGEEPSYLKEEYADSMYENEFLLPAFLRKHPIYNIRGGNPISLIGKTLSAPVAVDALETAIAFGCKRVFLFGLCGGISQDLNIGDMIVPTEIIREEGTSYHYMQSNLNAEPDKELLGQLISYLGSQCSLKVFTGKTVTTDAVFRQTLKKERKWQSNGVLGVDMEMSALLTVAKYHQIPAVSLLVVSDKHKLKANAKWQWGGDKLERNRKIAINLFIDFVRKLGKYLIMKLVFVIPSTRFRQAQPDGSGRRLNEAKDQASNYFSDRY